MAEEDDNEANTRKKIKDSLLKKFEAIGENDFEFVKVRQKKYQSLILVQIQNMDMQWLKNSWSRTTVH